MHALILFFYPSYYFNNVTLSTLEPHNTFETAIWIYFVRNKKNKWYLLSADYELQFMV